MTDNSNTGPGESLSPVQSPPRRHDTPGTAERAPPVNTDTAVSATGIEGLDFIMRGGLPTGRPTLLRGGPGTGKTVIALSILCHGLDTGEPGVLVTFDESRQALLQHSDSLGLSLREHVENGRARILDMRPDR